MARRTLCIILCATTIATSTTIQQAQAQSGEDVAKGLLRALIESQLEKSRRKNNPQTGSLRNPNQQRGPRPGQLTNEIQQLRPITASFAQESATLVALMNTAARRDFEIRRRLPDAIRLQATATALNQQAASQSNHRAMLDGFRNLNAEWTTLSHQLNQCKSLTPQTQAAVKRMAALDAQYCSILGLQEQFDSTQLIREAYTLSTYLRDLTDEVRDSGAIGVNHTVLRNLGRVSQEADYFAQLVARGIPFARAVTEYQQLYKGWQSVDSSLENYSARAVTRTMRRIRDSHRTIHGLLRLEMGIDQELVLHLVHEIDHELTDLYKSITLEQLMSVPDGDAVTTAADAAYGTIQNLDDLVHRKEPPQAIAEAWVYADEAWKMFAYYVSPIRDAQTQASLRSIGDSMESLRRMMGVTVEFDRNAMVNSASLLETKAAQLVASIRRWQTHPGNHDRRLVNQVESLVEQCHSLEQSLLAGRQPNQLRRTCDTMVTLWQQIRPELKKCDTDEREEINYVTATFTPELIRLRTMLGE